MRRFVTLLRAIDSAAEWLIFDVLLSARWRARTLVMLTIAAGFAAGWSWDRAVAPAATTALSAEAPLDGKLLFRRPWIDRRPENYKDRFSLYVFGDEEIDDDLYAGVVLTGIPVKYLVEFYGFRPKGNRIGFWFPADDSKAGTGYRITREKNGRFDLKLELDADPRHGGRPHTYYGRMDGELDMPGVTFPAEVKKYLGRK